MPDTNLTSDKPNDTPTLDRRQFLQAAAIAGAGLAMGADTEIVAGASPIKNAVPDVARQFPLSAVRVTGGPLKHAQDMDAAYLLKLEPDRMMAYFRIRCGLTPKAEAYGGWDGDAKNLTGHVAGHHLSGVSLMYAATGDVKFKQRADYLVNEMREVQDKNGDGCLCAMAQGKEKFAEVAAGNIRAASFDLNGLWSPWYVEHKIFAGLRDAYRYTGSKAALDVEVKFAGWAESVLAKLDAEQDQKMLRTEFGGMSEVMADLYADTGDKRWLALSDRFEHRAVLDPLSRKEDNLGGLHGNATIPKLIGCAARYRYTGNSADGAAANFFWDAVVNHHTFATGGHGKDEYFGPPDKLSPMVDGRTDESCNVYNMLKLTRTLFGLQPDIKYAEFMERAMFNHVLGSMDPEDGRTCYMVPVGRGVTHEYQDMFGSFTCCVGTGMENHALYGGGIYYENGDKLWVNLFVPSTAMWKSVGVGLTMETTFPEGETASLTLNCRSTPRLTILLRRPLWAGEGFAVKVNGQAVTELSKPGSYVQLKRSWKTGDTVSVTLPRVLHAELLPDNPRRVALLWGPLVLGGDLGPEQRRRRAAAGQAETIPVFAAADRPVSEWLKPVAGMPGSFRTDGVGKVGQDRHDVDFVPFYRLHWRTYGVYWDLVTPEKQS